MAKLAFVGRPTNLHKEPEVHEWAHWPEQGHLAPVVRVPEFRKGNGLAMSYVTVVDYQYWKTTSAGVMLYRRPGYRVGSL